MGSSEAACAGGAPRPAASAPAGEQVEAPFPSFPR